MNEAHRGSPRGILAKANKKLKFLHIATHAPDQQVFAPVFREALQEFGALTIVENGKDLSAARRADLIRGCDVLLTGWGAAPVPVSIAAHPGQLKYICHVTGGMTGMVPIEVIEAGIPVTNWGDAPAHSIAEGAMTLLLATLKDLHRQVMAVRNGKWYVDWCWTGGTLEDAAVGIYGCGFIARCFVEMIRPFKPVLRVFDPYVKELPAGCRRANSLPELFSNSRIIVIHAGLTEETRNTVTAELLALLPKYSVIINTARGGIIDQAALFAELESGRLRAGLDVLDPDSLPADHPARKWENCLLTCHYIHRGWPTEGKVSSRLVPMHRIGLDNLRRFTRGEPLRFRMDRDRYLRST